MQLDIFRTDRCYHWFASKVCRRFSNETCFSDLHMASRGHSRQKIHRANEVSDKWRCRCAVDFFRCTDLFDTSVVHDDNSVCHRQGFFLIMCHHDRRHTQALLQFTDFPPQPNPYLCIQCTEWLVK